MRSTTPPSTLSLLGLLLVVTIPGQAAELWAAPRASKGSSGHGSRVRSSRSPRATVKPTDVVWTRVRKALLARPLDSHARVATVLSKDRKLSHIKKIDAAFITKQIDAHEGRQAVKTARDRVVAERVAARLKTAPAKTTLRSLATMLGDELPGIKDHNLARLKLRHPDILGDLSARSMNKPVPPAARARIKALALAHPTLSYAQLATVFKKDTQLKGVLTWTEAEVSRLREPSRILPSETKRGKALARLAAEHLAAQPTGTSLDAAITSLQARHPGVDRAQLMKMAPRTPALAKAIRRLQPGVAGGAATTTAPVLDLALARKLNPGRMVIQRSLERSGSTLVGRYSTMLERLEREAGDANGELSPRDLAASKDPHLAAVMNKVYKQAGGRRSLSLSVVNRHLPEAIAAVATNGRLKRGANHGPLYLEAVNETMGQISKRYHKEVLGGTRSSSAFAGALGLTSVAWNRLQKTMPAALPRPGEVALTGRRLKGVSALYHKLLAGELTTTGFYKRAKITAAQLRLLQTTDPKNFPRPEGTASWKTVAGRREADRSDSSLATLSRAWHEQVLGGVKGVNQFKRDHGVSHHRLSRLYREHPDLFPRKGKHRSPLGTGGALAHAAGKKAMALFDGDVLLRRAQIITAINKDAAFVARHGKLNRTKYEALQMNNPHLFPPLKDTNVALERLAGEARKILKGQPGLPASQLAATMQAKHPSFKLSRIYQLRRAFPDLQVSLPQAATAVPVARRRADARRLAGLMKTRGGEKGAIAAIARELGKEDSRFSRAYLYRLRKEFSADYFSSGAAARKPQVTERSNRVVAQLYQLAIRLSPPGASEGTLRDVLNRMLVERDLPPFTGRGAPANILRRTYREHGNLTRQSARVVAAVVAEYARAATRGTSEQQILARVLKDYPTLDHKKLNAYRKLWRAKPRDYAELGPFYARGKLSISGQGRGEATARYRGGWDLERAVLKPASRGDRALAGHLADLSQYARMPAGLPLLDKMVTDLKGSQPLRGKNVLWVSHLLATAVPLAGALRQAGTLAKSTIVVGTPYGTNPAVRKVLKEDGFDVRVPPLSVAKYEAAVRRAVDDMVKQHRRNHKPVVVLDDGGLVTKILHSNPKYADVRHAFKIVEQTTRGITVAEQQKLEVPVINVARSLSKRAEGRFIGQAVAAKVLQGLRRDGRELSGARVTVMGYGIVGQAVAAELKRAGARVTVVESSGSRAKAARKARFTVTTRDRALPTSDVVIGATGYQSLSLADLRLLPTGAVIASASSKQVEFDMNNLRKKASARKLMTSDNPLVRLPTARYTLGSKKITVLGDGWPVNFDGDVEDIPARHIQLTRAVMFAGALQAAGLKTNHAKNRGLMPLDRTTDRWILKQFKSVYKQRGLPEVHDPARWMEVIRGVARHVGVPGSGGRQGRRGYF